MWFLIPFLLGKCHLPWWFQSYCCLSSGRSEGCTKRKTHCWKYSQKVSICCSKGVLVIWYSEIMKIERWHDGITLTFKNHRRQKSEDVSRLQLTEMRFPTQPVTTLLSCLTERKGLGSTVQNEQARPKFIRFQTDFYLISFPQNSLSKTWKLWNVDGLLKLF